MTLSMLQNTFIYMAELMQSKLKVISNLHAFSSVSSAATPQALFKAWSGAPAQHLNSHQLRNAAVSLFCTSIKFAFIWFGFQSRCDHSGATFDRSDERAPRDIDPFELSEVLPHGNTQGCARTRAYVQVNYKFKVSVI